MVDQFKFDVEGDPPMKQIREKLGLTQQEFAGRLGVAMSTLSRWENGKGNALLSAGQFKILLSDLEPYGITLKDLPDDLSRPAGQS
jgi:transcriptional regulator with XRE-family HTH domain